MGSSIPEPSLLLMPGLEGQGTQRLLSLSIPWSCMEAYALHPPLSPMLMTMMLVRDVPRSDFYSYVCVCSFVYWTCLSPWSRLCAGVGGVPLFGSFYPSLLSPSWLTEPTEMIGQPEFISRWTHLSLPLRGTVGSSSIYLGGWCDE